MVSLKRAVSYLLLLAIAIAAVAEASASAGATATAAASTNNNNNNSGFQFQFHHYFEQLPKLFEMFKEHTSVTNRRMSRLLRDRRDRAWNYDK